jgi:LPS-assembly protein
LAQTSISQSDISFRWPLFAGWYGLGRWQYAFNYAKTTESFIGVEKENCCWRLRVIGRRYINGATTTNILAPDAKPETAVFVQLELKGLTSFGDSVDQFLQQNLNGYRPANYFED